MISLLLWFIASILNGAMDMNFNMYHSSVFSGLKSLYWNPYEGWRYKYKNGNPEEGERFLGSTTIFSSVTDSWHLFKGGMLVAILSAILTFDMYYIVEIWWLNALIVSIIYALVWFIGFESTLKLLKK